LRKQLELPPEAARHPWRDGAAHISAKDQNKRDEIVAGSVRLSEFRPRDKSFASTPHVIKMFNEMKD